MQKKIRNVFGKQFKVPDLNIPMPEQPEAQASIHLHNRRPFILKNTFKDALEGQDYVVE